MTKRVPSLLGPSLLAAACLCGATILSAAQPAPPAPPTLPAATGGAYAPKVGDSVAMLVRTVRSGKALDVQAILKEQLVPKMTVDEIVSDTYFLAEDGGNGILALHFTPAKFAARAPYQAVLEEKLLSLLLEPTKKRDYRVVLAMDEGFLPKEGDKAVLFWWQVKKGSLAEAEALVRDQVFPALKMDPFKRRSFLIEDAAGSALVGVAFLRGEVVLDPKVVEKRKLLGPLLESPERVVTYTLFHFLDE